MPVDPESLYIVEYPDPILRRKAAEVPAVNDEVRAVARRMIELMHEAEGVGLAAPQVGLAWRMFVAHVPEGEDRSASADPPTASVLPQVFVNPVLTHHPGPLEPLAEGCLSLPEVTGDVFRPAVVSITATDLDGERFSLTAAGLLGRCFQHEMDHLDGVLILDRMTQMSRLKNRSHIRELERSAKRA
ncbi:MAG: peptide deformylase [Phycisphaeraceae bacterium]|nr:peptide deformylase [Phycisphaeraceae bacterium]